MGCLMKRVMAGHSRLKDGVASARLCPGHPRLSCQREVVDVRGKPGHDEKSEYSSGDWKELNVLGCAPRFQFVTDRA
jgi:hypothetical protein